MDPIRERDFQALSKLLGEDRSKVAMLVRVFYRSVALDMLRLEGAASSGIWTVVRLLANRVAIACVQLGEMDLAHELEPISNAPDDSETCMAFRHTYADTRADLIELLDRAGAYAE